MSTNPVTGTWLIRRMRAAFSSRSGLGIARRNLVCFYAGQGIADVQRLIHAARWRKAFIAASKPLHEQRLRSRCVVHTSSGSVGTHGGTTGPPHHDSAARADDAWRQLYATPGRSVWASEDDHRAAILWAKRRVGELWGEWGWTE